MIAGHVFAVLYGRKRGIRISGVRKTDAQLMLELAEESNSHEHITDPDIRENTKERLRFRKMPWLLWACGTIFILCFCFAEYSLLHKNQPHTWEQFLIALLLLSVGIWFFAEAKIETVVFDKVSKTLLLTHISCFSSRKYACHAFDEIASVRAVKQGKRRGFNHDTTYFAVKIYFKNGQALRILSSKTALRVKKELLCLRRFLGIELDKPIHI